MTVNHIPRASKINETGCCPKFDPEGWDNQTFTFQDKLFVRFTVSSFFYIPLNMGSQMVKLMKTVEEAGATSKDEPLMLSYDSSPWRSEHYLAVTKEVKELENTRLSGTFYTKVFEGPFKDAPKWIAATKEALNKKGKVAKKIYLNYTMCPGCAKTYGKNYVVAFAKLV